MSDLISREEAIGVLETMTEIEEGIEMMYALPTIEAEPVRHGEWICIGDYDCDNNAPFECSNCHAGDTHAKGVRVPYCWKCGAKMDGGDQSE